MKGSTYIRTCTCSSYDLRVIAHLIKSIRLMKQKVALERLIKYHSVWSHENGLEAYRLALPRLARPQTL